MPFPPKKDTSAPAQGKDQPPQSSGATHSTPDSGHCDNASHDGNHGSFAPNGHHTPDQQSQHQAALNQDHGAGSGSQGGDHDN